MDGVPAITVCTTIANAGFHDLGLILSSNVQWFLGRISLIDSEREGNFNTIFVCIIADT